MDYQLIGTGTIDAYIRVLYKGKKLVSKTIKMENNTVPWMEDFLIPVELPVIKNKLTIELWDADIGYD